MKSGSHHYIPAFDGVRALAIIPVLLLHVSAATLPSGWLRFQFSRGWYGVDLFFVLSGFLITWILIEELEATGTIALPRFFSRRLLRLGPAYAPALIIPLIGAALLHPSALYDPLCIAPALLTYTYNYQLAMQGPHVDLIVVVWSLCVEEQFYLMWPWLLRTLGLRRGFYFCIFAIAALALYRTALYSWLNWGHLAKPGAASCIRIYFSTDTRIDVIVVGCLFALSLRHESCRRLWAIARGSRLVPYIAVAIVVICVSWVTGGDNSNVSIRSATIGCTAGAIAVAGLIAAIFTHPNSIISRSLAWPPLVRLGKVSYGVYLFHLTIAYLLYHLLRPPLWSRVSARMSDPALLGAALPVSKATVVPMSDALGRASAILADNQLLQFLIASVAIGLIAFAAASIHFELIERRFMALRRPEDFRAAIPGRET